MLLAAQHRGWELLYLEQRDLWLRDGVAMGRARPLARARRRARTGSRSASRGRAASADFDAILMRKDPPFDTEYIYTTYILERAEMQGALVVNRPAGPARHEREGVHGLVSAVLRADADHARHGRHARLPARARQRVVCKPLYGMGGRSIFVVDARRQERERHLRDADRLRHALRDRAALHPRHRDDRRLARAAGRRRARAVRARAHPDRGRQPRQSRRRRQGRRPRRSTSAIAGSPRRSARRCASAACCSSAST